MINENIEKDTILQSFSKFIEQTSQAASIEIIKNDIHKETKENFTELCKNSRILSNFYYSLIKQKLINCQSTLDYEQNKHLFSKIKTQKSSFSSNIDDIFSFFTRNQPELFSQVVYSTLPDSDLFDKDDVLYFSFCTISTMFKYYITLESQQNFTQFFLGLIEIHSSIYGFNFNSKHLFIKQILLSFFNQFGVCDLVNKCFIDTFPNHADNLLSSMNKYIKIDDGLSRLHYNYYIDEFAKEFVSRLPFYIPLLREPIITLISKIVEIDEGNILTLYFIFDSLIADQLSESFEFCNIFEKYKEKVNYINDAIKNIAWDLSKYLKNIYKQGEDSQIRKDIIAFVNKIVDYSKQINEIDEKEYYKGFLFFSPCSYVSERDISLLYFISSSFISYIDDKENDTPEQILQFISLYERHLKQLSSQNSSENSPIHFGNLNYSKSVVTNPLKPIISPTHSMSASLNPSHISTTNDLLNDSMNSANPTLSQLILNKNSQKYDENDIIYYKVIEYQQHGYVEQFAPILSKIQNKDLYDTSFSFLNLTQLLEIYYKTKQQNPSTKQEENDLLLTDFLIDNLTQINPELIFHKHNARYSIEEIKSMAEKEKINYEKLVSILTITNNYINENCNFINSKINEMRILILKIGFEHEIDALLFKNDFIHIPLFLEGIYLAIHNLCCEKSLEEYENVIQQIGMMRTYELFGRSCYTFDNPLTFSDFEQCKIKLEKLKQEKNMNQTKVDNPKIMKERKEKCTKSVLLLNYSNFNFNLIYSIVITAMKEINSLNDLIICEAILDAKILYMKDYQKFFSTFIYNKQRFLSTFGKEENQLISQFINAINKLIT